jgi:hypothetical protein
VFEVVFAYVVGIGAALIYERNPHLPKRMRILYAVGATALLALPLTQFLRGA